jgi:hypothetical protein
MDLEIVCIINCDDCGKSVIIDPTYVTIFIGDENLATAAALCSHCERPVVEDISIELAKSMSEKNVKVLSWLNGEEINLNEFI